MNHRPSRYCSSSPGVDVENAQALGQLDPLRKLGIIFTCTVCTECLGYKHYHVKQGLQSHSQRNPTPKVDRDTVSELTPRCGDYTVPDL
jgi:hypothetical protein